MMLSPNPEESGWLQVGFLCVLTNHLQKLILGRGLRGEAQGAMGVPMAQLGNIHTRCDQQLSGGLSGGVCEAV